MTSVLHWGETKARHDALSSACPFIGTHAHPCVHIDTKLS